MTSPHARKPWERHARRWNRTGASCTNGSTESPKVTDWKPVISLQPSPVGRSPSNTFGSTIEMMSKPNVLSGATTIGLAGSSDSVAVRLWKVSRFDSLQSATEKDTSSPASSPWSVSQPPPTKICESSEPPIPNTVARKNGSQLMFAERDFGHRVDPSPSN